MNRTILIPRRRFRCVESAAGGFPPSKAPRLLIVAGLTALILRRDSAATRHLVWLLAIVAMLAVPVLSAMLPQWRVLPKWASAPSAAAVVAAKPPSIARPAVGAVEVARSAGPEEVESPSCRVAAFTCRRACPDSPPELVKPQAAAGGDRPHLALAERIAARCGALGFCVLVLRADGRPVIWMLGKTERQGTVVWPNQGNLPRQLTTPS